MTALSRVPCATRLQPAQRGRVCAPFTRCHQHPARHTPAVRCQATGFSPTSAKEAIETGTTEFEKKNYEDALQLYQKAMGMSPDNDEARAAMYNSACVHAKQGRWQAATDAIKTAVNEYNLKLSVAKAVRGSGGHACRRNLVKIS